MKRINFVVLIAILVFPVLSACSATPTPAPTPVPTDTAVPTAVPSATPEPTNTPPPEPDTPTPEPTPEPPEITVKKSPNLVYLDDGDSAHKLDLYIPDGMEGLLPILFIIPGLSQNRAALATQARHFANMGYATAVVGYRDPMENVYPIPIQVGKTR